MNCDKLTQSVSDKIESKVTGVCSCAAAANTWIIAETALFTILSLPLPPLLQSHHVIHSEVDKLCPILQ